MRAFTITAPNQGEVREIPMPVPGPGEAVLKVAYCGICGTDYHIYQGDFLSPYPLVNGHEFSGVISALGDRVDGWQEGDRVAVDPTLYCGHCYHCLRRQANHCDHWGAIGDTTTGAFAEYVRVPIRNLFRVVPGNRVLLFGAGPIGDLLTQMLDMSCTADVTVVDLMDEKLRVVRELGATATFINGPDLKAQLMDRTRGRGYDIVLDCTGVATVIEGMFEYAAPNAKIMFFGVASPKARISISPFDVYHQDWEILGSMAINYTFQQARDLLAAGRIKVKPLLTHVAGLEEVADILGRPKTATELKTLVQPNVD